MPEIVEVQIQAEGLNRLTVGKKIVTVEFEDKGDLIIRPETPANFINRVVGKRIKLVRRNGKYIVFNLQSVDALEDDILLASHLRMTGRWLVNVPEAPGLEHTRIRFHLDDGTVLRYSDVRAFGTLKFVDDFYGLSKGLDVFRHYDFEIHNHLIKVLSPRMGDWNLKKLLLKQEILCGIGNVYANEILFYMRANPGRLLKTMSEADLVELCCAIENVIQLGYERGGLSLKDWVHVDGTKGHAQDYLMVYRQDVCRVCGGDIVRSEEFDGRATYYCPSCQYK